MATHNPVATAVLLAQQLRALVQGGAPEAEGVRPRLKVFGRLPGDAGLTHGAMTLLAQGTCWIDVAGLPAAAALQRLSELQAVRIVVVHDAWLAGPPPAQQILPLADVLALLEGPEALPGLPLASPTAVPAPALAVPVSTAHVPAQDQTVDLVSMRGAAIEVYERYFGRSAGDRVDRLLRRQASSPDAAELMRALAEELAQVIGADRAARELQAALHGTQAPPSA